MFLSPYGMPVALSRKVRLLCRAIASNQLAGRSQIAVCCDQAACVRSQWKNMKELLTAIDCVMHYKAKIIFKPLCPLSLFSLSPSAAQGP